jgi:hypothetical protein
MAPDHYVFRIARTVADYSERFWRVAKYTRNRAASESDDSRCRALPTTGYSFDGNVIAIPESGSVAHVKENAVALSLRLTPQELQTLDAAHPPPGR